MPQQLDLLPASLDAIEPEAGRVEPRLWVRRLVIWKEPGVIIRDVALRPGLNIIWSPDSGAEGEAMGHGGGKSSFCRLLRYCLGEDSFGSQEQRHLIGTALPGANVGAEILLDGVLWIVVRPIGNPRGRHFCSEGGDLDAAFHADMAIPASRRCAVRSRKRSCRQPSCTCQSKIGTSMVGRQPLPG